MTTRAAVSTSLVLALLAASLPARADNASLAEALFRQAREAMRAGNFAAACPELAESQRLDPSAGTSLNLAVCEEHEGRIATAWAHFRAVVDELPSTDPRVPVARDRATALEPKLPWLRVVLPPGTTGVAITVDGTPLREASIGVELPVDPGTHVVEARAAVGEHRTSVSVTEGEHRPVMIDLSQMTPRALPPAQVRAHSSARVTVGWAGVAAGGGGIVTSLVLGALALQKQGVVTAHCPARQCDPTGLNAAHDGTILETAATASFAIGLVALGAGTYLVVSAPAPSANRGSGLTFVGLRGTF